MLGPCNPSCCGSSDPTTCLSSGGSVDTNQQGCNTVANFLSICESYTPSFFSLPATEQVSCLCYSYSDFRPDLWDGAAGKCYSYLDTQIPTAAASFSSADVDFCTRFGPAQNVDASTTTSEGPSSSQISFTSDSPTASTTSATGSASSETSSESNDAMTKLVQGDAANISKVVALLLLAFVAPQVFEYST